MPHRALARKYGASIAPKISSSTPPEIQVQGQRIRFKGVAIFGLIDAITVGGEFGAGKVGIAKYQEENRALICKTVKEWGGNFIRLRVLAEEYETATNYGASKANYAKAVLEWVEAADAQGLYTMISAWDPLDSSKKGSGWIANQGYVNPMFKAFHEKFKTHEKVFYEPANEPNGLTEAQNVTNFETTIKYFRKEMKYGGVIVVDPSNWANSGTGGAGYNVASYEILQGYDKEQLEANSLGTVPQLAFAKHDYANEYAGKTWSESGWLAACGGNQTQFVIFETEFGNYNGSEETVSATWAKGAAKFFYERFSQRNYAGACAFIWFWFDKNRITKNHESEGTDSLTTPSSPWGETAKGFLEEKLQEGVLSPVVPGVDMNNTGGEVDWLRAATAGARVGRAEEGRWTMDNATKFALKYGMKVCWLFQGTQPAGGNISALLNTYKALPEAQRNTIIAFEYLNEIWPGGAHVEEFTGEAYGTRFIKVAKEAKEARVSAKIAIPPLLMQVRFDQSIGKSWMESLAKVSHTQLKEALEPQEGLPTGNWLSSHPYFGKWTLAQKEPNNLGGTYQDTVGTNNWGSQRLLKEVRFIQEITGLNVPCAVTEYGVSGIGAYNSGNNAVGGWPAVAEWTKATFEFLKQVENGIVPAGNFPTGLTSVKIPFFIWFAQYSFSSVNSYGFLTGENFPKAGNKVGDPNEEGGFYKAWKEGANSL